MLGGLGGIILALRDGRIKQRVCRVDREVVPHPAIATQDLVHHFLAVDGVFQCEAQVVVVKWGRIDVHDEHVVAGARYAFDVDVGSTRQKLRNFWLDAVNHVNLTGLEGRCPGRCIVQNDVLHGI